MLQAEHDPHGSLTITLGMLVDTGSTPVHAEIIRDNGSTRRIELMPTESAVDASDIRTLSDPEKIAFRQCLKREDFT